MKIMTECLLLVLHCICFITKIYIEQQHAEKRSDLVSKFPFRVVRRLVESNSEVHSLTRAHEDCGHIKTMLVPNQAYQPAATYTRAPTHGGG